MKWVKNECPKVQIVFAGCYRYLIFFFSQVLTELHPSPQPHTVLPCVSSDLHPAGEGRGSFAEQLLHYQPDGRAAAAGAGQLQP